MSALMDADVTALAGPKGRHEPARTAAQGIQRPTRHNPLLGIMQLAAGRTGASNTSSTARRSALTSSVAERSRRVTARLWGTLRLAVEPGGAAALAAAMTGLSSSAHPVVVLSGANVPAAPRLHPDR